MHAYATPALYCLFVWWFSTGVIVFLNNLPSDDVQMEPWGRSA